MVLGVCVNADTEASPTQRIYFAGAQKHCSDEQIISFWLSVSNLEDHQVPMFVAKHWASRSSNFIEWMILLDHNTQRHRETTSCAYWLSFHATI